MYKAMCTYTHTHTQKRFSFFALSTNKIAKNGKNVIRRRNKRRTSRKYKNETKPNQKKRREMEKSLNKEELRAARKKEKGK